MKIFDISVVTKPIVPINLVKVLYPNFSFIKEVPPKSIKTGPENFWVFGMIDWQNNDVFGKRIAFMKISTFK